MFYIKLNDKLYLQTFYFEDDTEQVVSEVECTIYQEARLLFDSEKYANYIAEMICGTVYKR